jgi:taurine transport system permease protein
MTDLAVVDAQTPPPDQAPLRLVKMHGFCIGERSTLPISIGAGAVIVALWWVASEARIVSHLFLPTPGEVAAAAVSI